MAEEILRVLVQDGRVLAPAVGLWGDHPQAGALLGPGALILARTSAAIAARD